MKFLIFDAGPLISLALSGMLGILEKVKNKEIEFIITPQVKKEVIDRAMTIKKYKLEAVRISDLLEKGILKISSEFIKDEDLFKETINCVNLSKKLISVGKEKISIIQEGEASCLAFSKLIGKENLIVIDERTTRMVSESIDNLKELMSKKLHMKIQINRKELDYFKNFRYIRSSELMFLAFKRGLIDLKKDKETLDALLYSLKFRGAAISSREIEKMKEMV
jgi:hypothetical protein